MSTEEVVICTDGGRRVIIFKLIVSLACSSTHQHHQLSIPPSLLKLLTGLNLHILMVFLFCVSLWF